MERALKDIQHQEGVDRSEAERAIGLIQDVYKFIIWQCTRMYRKNSDFLVADPSLIAVDETRMPVPHTFADRARDVMANPGQVLQSAAATIGALINSAPPPAPDGQ